MEGRSAMSGDYGLGYKVHEDAYCQLQEEAERYRLESNAMMLQRDNLVDALELLLDGLLTYAPDYMHGLPKRHYVDEAMEALAAAKGGKP
jgi:hypothetical protein